MSDEAERPVFGRLPARKPGGRPSTLPTKGQRRAIPENQLPPKEPAVLSKKEARRKLIIGAKAKERSKSEWDELIIPAEPNGEITHQGRYYQIGDGDSPLGLFSVPPGVGNASRFYNLQPGDWVFVRRDSWESKDSRRKGWGHTFVLAGEYKTGQNPKIRNFDDHGFVRHAGYVKYQSLIDRQVITG